MGGFSLIFLVSLVSLIQFILCPVSIAIDLFLITAVYIILASASEKNLYAALTDIKQRVEPMLENADYEPALENLAALRESVDNFFDNVMVMSENEALKNNRIALLNQMRSLFMRVADISRLQS